ncbi:hypothetical protein RND71_013809 [Anisodus tanguticus]|uniref:Uncharacterized protein n=1 Tax=Anisodus tanguticus TaxID=243964 RepID=A0AAE1SA41_9SOLA|nr:hypothetical protein RND71_013809 [Anisodus tanguticus]
MISLHIQEHHPYDSTQRLAHAPLQDLPSVSHTFDSLKPWSLTLTDTSSSKVSPTSLVRPAISSLNARSYSFASPIARTPRGSIGSVKKGFFPSTPLPQKTQDLLDPSINNHPRAMRPSFFQSSAMFFKKDCHVSKSDKSRELFVPLLKYYRRPYDEMTYRSKMRPPLGGLISIVSPHIKRHYVSVSQRF